MWAARLPNLLKQKFPKILLRFFGNFCYFSNMEKVDFFAKVTG